MRRASAAVRRLHWVDSAKMLGLLAALVVGIGVLDDIGTVDSTLALALLPLANPKALCSSLATLPRASLPPRMLHLAPMALPCARPRHRRVTRVCGGWEPCACRASYVPELRAPDHPLLGRGLRACVCVCVRERGRERESARERARAHTSVRKRGGVRVRMRVPRAPMCARA